MGIALQISTIIQNEDEGPRVAYKFDYDDDFQYRELFTFYTYLKYITRQVEALVDECIEEENEE